MKKYYITSLFIGLILIFVLQLLSYINWLLIDQGVINGIIDKTLLLKTPLIIIPIIFFAISFIGLVWDNQIKFKK